MSSALASIFIADGYTGTRTIPAVPGMHPELRVVFRPALAVVRLQYRAVLSSGDHDAAIRRENELFAKHVLTINGVELPAGQLSQMKPKVRADLLNLILGYEPEQEEQDAKN